MLRRTLLAGFAVLVLTATASAGPVYIALVLDPATTAGAGQGSVARTFSTGSFSVTSTLSGAGKWHLYALDDISTSLGLSSISVPVGGTAAGHLNRTPNAGVTNYNDVDETDIQQATSAGFSDALVRSGGSNPVNPVQGSQVIGSFQDILGMGRTAGNFNNTPNLVVPGDHRTWAGVTSGLWGNYATSPTAAQVASFFPTAQGAIDAGRKWLFLGEGTYSGANPTLGLTTAGGFYDSTDPQGLLHFTPITPSNGGFVQAVIPAGAVVPEPATLSLIGLALVGGLSLRRRRS